MLIIKVFRSSYSTYLMKNIVEIIHVLLHIKTIFSGIVIGDVFWFTSIISFIYFHWNISD